MANHKPLRELLLESMQSVAGVAPSAMMMMRSESVSAALDFAETKPEAAYAEKRLRQYLGDPNWLLSERSLDEAFQLIGELQFWMMSEASGVPLDRIPESDKKTPDFKTASSIPEVRFEVKALSVVSGQFALGEMAENSFKTQLNLQAQITAGKKVAMAETVIAPHGSPKPGIGLITSVCKRLIEKARQNIKADQYRGAKTFLVLNLILIDVNAGVILTHIDGVKLTHLGEDGGFRAAEDVDPGECSGDTSVGPTRNGDPGDRKADGVLAQYRETVRARGCWAALRAAHAASDQAGRAQGVCA